MTAFRADGKVDYVQDTNGNRITAGYTNGLLDQPDPLVGPVAPDRLQQRRPDQSITDPASGRTTTYTYDASNEHLLSATTFDGRTTTLHLRHRQQSGDARTPCSR